MVSVTREAVTSLHTVGMWIQLQGADAVSICDIRMFLYASIIKDTRLSSLLMTCLLLRSLSRDECDERRSWKTYCRWPELETSLVDLVLTIPDGYGLSGLELDHFPVGFGFDDDGK